MRCEERGPHSNVHDADGHRIVNTTNDDGGDGLNSKATFTALETGTFDNAAGACNSNLGTCEVKVTDNTPDHFLNG